MVSIAAGAGTVVTLRLSKRAVLLEVVAPSRIRRSFVDPFSSGNSSETFVHSDAVSMSPKLPIGDHCVPVKCSTVQS